MPFTLFQAQYGALAPELLMGFALALAISALGFVKVVYFVSIGYAFSVSANALALILIHRSNLDWISALHLLFLLLYGIRLGAYLSIRETKEAFAREKADTIDRGSSIGAGQKLVIWLGVAVLYVVMVSPALYNVRSILDGRSRMNGFAAVGIGIMALGLSMETIADLQKSAYKSKNPDRFCDVGLYRIVRCPNYLGEILVWTGSTVAGASSLRGALPWAMALAGWMCITLIMMGSTKRLEGKQDERYGEREDYRSYIKSVPVLFPLVPLYSLKNVKVYLE